MVSGRCLEKRCSGLIVVTVEMIRIGGLKQDVGRGVGCAVALTSPVLYYVIKYI